jgi:dTDP-4-amino-4,6-dideoxygalactose transaminase
MATFSFYATKNLQCGEGGVVTTNDAAFADRIRLLRNQGMRSRYDYEVPGHNYRLTDLSAAVAVPQFARLRSIIESRERNATFYNEMFRDLEGIVTPEVAPGTSHAWHQYTLRITGSARRTRDSVLAGLSERGVGAGIYYRRAVYDYECFRGNPQVRVDGGCPVADRVGREVLSLPVHQYLTRADRDVVASAVRDLLSSSA